MIRRRTKGFTIVELVIVIAVIGILAAVLIPTFSGIIQKANDSATIQKARNMYSEYVSSYNYTNGTPETNFIIKVDDDKFVAVVKGQIVTDTIYLSEKSIVSANIGIVSNAFVYEGIKYYKVTFIKNDFDVELDGELTAIPGDSYEAYVICDVTYNIAYKVIVYMNDEKLLETGKSIHIESVTGDITIEVIDDDFDLPNQN